MCDYAIRRLEKSVDDLNAAKICYDAGLFDAAANRAYYVIYHALRAVLALDNIERSKHSGNISYFREHYIATDIFDRAYSDTIKNAENLRNEADYDDMLTTSAEDAIDVINKANSFLISVREHVTNRVAQKK